MCGRYTLYETGKLADRFKTSQPVFELHDSYNVAPGQTMSIVMPAPLDSPAHTDGKDRMLEPMKWGLIPFWAKEAKIGYKLINARSEGAFDKPAWRGPIKRKRCLVPCHGFYEWKRSNSTNTKQPYFIRPRDQELFAFAGLYDTWKDPDGNEVWSYTIMTTAPNAEMAGIHNRMPVILHPDDESLWLDPGLGEDKEERGVLEALLRPYADGQLEMYEVSSDVNVVRNGDKLGDKLIYPINSQ
jgi:putative SOS response-associated peptidase YedK